MIDIRIETNNGTIASHYSFEGKNKLNDVAVTLLELEKMKLIMLEESERFEPDVEITK